MRHSQKVIVTGAGGFIGHHLVSFLKNKGYWVRGVDLKYPEYKKTDANEFLKLDLRDKKNAEKATEGMKHTYALAADMGGMGFISSNNALILYNNALINLNTFEAARKNKVSRVFYSSSACIYPEYKQMKTKIAPLKEEDAYPAQPQDSYGWEKLITELLAKYYQEDYGLEARIARFHNIFGPLGTWDGGREKAPAAICRKVAMAKLQGKKEIEIWGDGKQTRSFCYIDDCLLGIYKLMMSDFSKPLNIGQDRMVTIDQLVDMVCKIAGVKLIKKHISGPQGVRGRNSDNSKLRKILKWEPAISLEEGMRRTYNWIEEQVKVKLKKMR
ncbi:NAD-dependent epimerase/dehydratase family protein [Candidatus Daviesbacteria bacterium]|nr:NAD-dependent epimerase/dehydratase family protein [Candidatus Daviesbacteria bacterium]